MHLHDYIFECWRPSKCNKTNNRSLVQCRAWYKLMSIHINWDEYHFWIDMVKDHYFMGFWFIHVVSLQNIGLYAAVRVRWSAWRQLFQNVCKSAQILQLLPLKKRKFQMPVFFIASQFLFDKPHAVSGWRGRSNRRSYPFTVYKRVSKMMMSKVLLQ